MAFRPVHKIILEKISVCVGNIVTHSKSQVTPVGDGALLDLSLLLGIISQSEFPHSIVVEIDQALALEFIKVREWCSSAALSIQDTLENLRNRATEEEEKKEMAIQKAIHMLDEL